MITFPGRRTAPHRVAACRVVAALAEALPLTSSQAAGASESADRYTFTNVKIGGPGFVYVDVAAVPPSATDPGTVWAAVGRYTDRVDPDNGAVLRSTDTGRTWRTTVLPSTLGGTMNGRGMGERLAADPADDRVLHLGAPADKGVCRGTEGGTLSDYGRGIVSGDPARR